MLKIVHLISSFKRGGRERQLAIIASNTDTDRYPTTIFYFNDYDHTYITEYGITNISRRIKSNGKIARILELNYLLKEENPDIVYSWGIGEAISILLIKPFHKFDFINGSIRHGIRSRKISHYLRSLVLHLSRNIVANSNAGLKANHIKRGDILYNGVDLELKEPMPKTQKYLKRIELTGVQKNKTLIISVANLVPYKDYFSIIKALALLKNENDSFFYLILGDGPMRVAIIELIDRLGLNNYIRLVGGVENVSDYLKISDLFIHSSKGEGCSNSILEAMAAGLPIIASNTGGTSELVTNRNGVLFEYKNHNQLYQIIKSALYNKNKYEVIGRNSIDIISKNFTIDIMMKNYYDILNKVSSR